MYEQCLRSSPVSSLGGVNALAPPEAGRIVPVVGSRIYHLPHQLSFKLLTANGPKPPSNNNNAREYPREYRKILSARPLISVRYLEMKTPKTGVFFRL